MPRDAHRTSRSKLAAQFPCGSGRPLSYDPRMGTPVDEPPGPDVPPPQRTHNRLARSTAIFSIATGLSRILGLVREIVVRRYFGVEGSINTFTVAFQLPNLLRSLVADAALSAAFVPVFSELLEKGKAMRAWRVASTLFWLVLLGLGGLTALFILLAPWLMKPFGYEGEQAELVVTLSRILFPTVVLLGLSGIVVGILNSYDHFTVPALAPVAWNLVIIFGVAIGVPRADRSRARSTSTPARCSLRPSSSSCSLCRGCAAATTGCGRSSTGATRPSGGSSC